MYILNKNLEFFKCVFEALTLKNFLCILFFFLSLPPSLPLPPSLSLPLSLSPSLSLSLSLPCKMCNTNNIAAIPLNVLSSNGASARDPLQANIIHSPPPDELQYADALMAEFTV